MPIFSIVVPSCKNQVYLAGCLDSVNKQDFVDWEALAIDNGSPDSSRSIVEEYSARDGRIKPQNEGTSRPKDWCDRRQRQVLSIWVTHATSKTRSEVRTPSERL